MSSTILKRMGLLGTVRRFKGLFFLVLFCFVFAIIYLYVISSHPRLLHQDSQRHLNLQNPSKRLSGDMVNKDHAADDNGADDFLAVSLSEELIQAASTISKKWGVTLFSVVNDAYLDMAFSWLCNTAVLNNVHDHVLFLATDLQTGERLRQQWPNISVVSMNGSQFSGEQEYSHAGYVRLMVERTHYIQHLVNSGLRLLLFEVDFVWLADPLPTVLSPSRLSEFDIVAIKVYGQSSVVCGCFLLLNPTLAVKNLWARLTEQMDELYTKVVQKDKSAPVSEGSNDQQFLSALIKSKYAGVRVDYFQEHLFPEGKWYELPKLRKSSPKPIIIHNNWIIGNVAKMERAKKFGHWFLANNSTSSNVVCNQTAVHHLISH